MSSVSFREENTEQMFRKERVDDSMEPKDDGEVGGREEKTSVMRSDSDVGQASLDSQARLHGPAATDAILTARRVPQEHARHREADWANGASQFRSAGFVGYLFM